MQRHNLQELTQEATLTTVATESQGAISTIAPGYCRFIERTFWDRSNQQELFGPLDEQEWQEMKALSTNPTRPHFRIRNDELLIYPVPTAGETWAFEYRSKNWVTKASDSSLTDSFSADGDHCPD